MRILVDKETGKEFEWEPYHNIPHTELGRLNEVKPKPKKIDWSKVNLDVVPVKVWDEEIAGAFATYLTSIDYKEGVLSGTYPFNVGNFGYKHASLITGKKIAWSGGECPLPEGVMIKREERSGFIYCPTEATSVNWNPCQVNKEIIAFEITGIAEGWEE